MTDEIEAKFMAFFDELRGLSNSDGGYNCGCCPNYIIQGNQGFNCDFCKDFVGLVSKYYGYDWEYKLKEILEQEKLTEIEAKRKELQRADLLFGVEMFNLGVSMKAKEARKEIEDKIDNWVKNHVYDVNEMKGNAFLITLEDVEELKQSLNSQVTPNTSLTTTSVLKGKLDAPRGKGEA